MKTLAGIAGVALVTALLAGACGSHGSVAATSSGTSTTTGAGGVGGTAGTAGAAGGSCVGTTPADVCGETMPCPSGRVCVLDMDLTTCQVYGAECQDIPQECAATPTCDCLLDQLAIDCTGDATSGFVVNYGFGDSDCCP